jgi:hypothetical protein
LPSEVIPADFPLGFEPTSTLQRLASRPFGDTGKSILRG